AASNAPPGGPVAINNLHLGTNEQPSNNAPEALNEAPAEKYQTAEKRGSLASYGLQTALISASTLLLRARYQDSDEEKIVFLLRATGALVNWLVGFVRLVDMKADVELSQNLERRVTAETKSPDLDISSFPTLVQRMRVLAVHVREALYSAKVFGGNSPFAEGVMEQAVSGTVEVCNLLHSGFSVLTEAPAHLQDWTSRQDQLEFVVAYVAASGVLRLRLLFHNYASFDDDQRGLTSTDHILQNVEEQERKTEKGRRKEEKPAN
ncbi:unnamed protein product, partial [Amoebophrya sp. A25]